MSALSSRQLASRALELQNELAQCDVSRPWYGKGAATLAGMADLPSQTRMLCDGTAYAARSGSTFAVSEDFTAIVEAGASSLISEWTEGNEEPEFLSPHDLPCPVGFVLFSREVSASSSLSDEDREIEMPVVGYLWLTDPNFDRGTVFIPLSDRKIWKERGSYVGFDAEKVSQSWGKMPSLLPHDWHGWIFGARWMADPNVPLGRRHRVDDGKNEALGIHPVAALDRAILWSFFRMLDQKIPRIEKVRADRNVERRSKKVASSEAVQDGVRIVMLRRESDDLSDEGSESSREWTRRWIVEGHWSRRRVATRDDEGNIIGSVQGVEGQDWNYRRVYIHPHVKGPSDKPLVVRPSVNVLGR